VQDDNEAAGSDIPATLSDLEDSWTHRAWWKSGWFKYYWPAFIGLLDLIVFAWWAHVERTEPTILSRKLGYQWDWMPFTVVLFYSIRLQLGLIPGIAILEDLEPSRWKSLVESGLTRWRILRAMLLHSLKVSIIPFTILTGFEIIAYITFYSILEEMSRNPIGTRGIVIFFVSSFFLGYSLVAIGYIFAMLSRRLWVVILGGFVPLMVYVTAAALSIKGGLGLMRISAYASLFTAPELAFDYVYHPWFWGERTATSPTDLCLIYTGTAIVLWVLVERLLNVRIRET
jgi:hypothetical protein